MHLSHLSLDQVAAVTSAVAAVVRVAGSIALIALARQAQRVQGSVFIREPWTRVHTAAAFEPLALGGVALGLAGERLHAAPTEPAPLAAVSGIGLTLVALAVMAWTVFSGPIVVGHYVTRTQRLRTTGPYARVRHPLYAGVLGLWLGMSVGLHSTLSTLVAVCFVLPTYFAYVRIEERLLEHAFGVQYRRYRERVPRFLPRVGARVDEPQELAREQASSLDEEQGLAGRP
jgi:protein-S-isoprenylcysteine O-methyltransferase Ste14